MNQSAFWDNHLLLKGVKYFSPLLALVVLIGCESEPDSQTLRVRGRYVGPQFDGHVAVIHHEAIPDVMGAMQMNFRVEEPTELADIPRGSAIAFDLVIRGDDWRIRRLEVLPDTTTLALQADSSAVPDPGP